MKLKLTILTALFAAGVFASFALADGGKRGKNAGRLPSYRHILGDDRPPDARRHRRPGERQVPDPRRHAGWTLPWELPVRPCA